MAASPAASVSSPDFSPHAPGLNTDSRLIEEGAAGMDERCVRRLARACEAGHGFLDAIDGLEVQALFDHYCMLVTKRGLWKQKKGKHPLTAVLRIIKDRLGIAKIDGEELYTHQQFGKDLRKEEQLLMLGKYLHSELSQAGVCAFSPGYWAPEVEAQERKEGNERACMALVGLYPEAVAQQEGQETLSAGEAGVEGEEEEEEEEGEEEEEEEEEGEEEEEEEEAEAAGSSQAAPKTPAQKKKKSPKKTPASQKKKQKKDKKTATPATPAARRKYALNMMLRYIAMLKAPALSAWVKPLSQCSNRGDLLSKRLHLFATDELLTLFMTGKQADFGGFLSGVDAAVLGENVQGWDVPPNDGLYDQTWFTCVHRKVVAALTSVVRRLNAKPPPKPSGKEREESNVDATTQPRVWESVAAVATAMCELEKTKGIKFTDHDLGALLFFIYQGEESTSVMSTLLRKLSDAEVFEAGGEKNAELIGIELDAGKQKILKQAQEACRKQDAVAADHQAMMAPLVEEQRAGREAQHKQFTMGFELQGKVAAAEIARAKAEASKAKTDQWLAILSNPRLEAMHKTAEAEIAKLMMPEVEPEPAAPATE